MGTCLAYFSAAYHLHLTKTQSIKEHWANLHIEQWRHSRSVYQIMTGMTKNVQIKPFALLEAQRLMLAQQASQNARRRFTPIVQQCVCLSS